MFVSSLIPSYKWKCEIFETFSLVEYKWIMTLKMECPIFKTLNTKTSTSCGHRIPSCQTFSYEIVRILNKSGSAMSRPQMSLYCKSLIRWICPNLFAHIVYPKNTKFRITNSHCNNLNWTLTTMLLNARNGSTVTRLLPSCILNGSFGELLQCCILKINLNRKDGRKKRRLKP